MHLKIQPASLIITIIMTIMWCGHLVGNLLPTWYYIPHYASPRLSPSHLYSHDGSITILHSQFPYHIIPILQPAIYSHAHCCAPAVSSSLRKGLVNNRPCDSSLLSGTSSVWKPFLHADTYRQEGLWGGGCVPFSLWTGSKCAKE